VKRVSRRSDGVRRRACGQETGACSRGGGWWIGWSWKAKRRRRKRRSANIVMKFRGRRNRRRFGGALMMNPLNWNQLRVVDDVNSVRNSTMCEFVREFGVRC